MKSMQRALVLLIASLAYVHVPVCIAQSDYVGLAAVYEGPQDKPLPCVIYSTRQFIAQVLRETGRKGDCTFPAPIKAGVDSPDFYASLDRIPDDIGVQHPERFEPHILFVLVANTGAVRKAVRLEQGLDILDDLTRYASGAVQPEVRSRLIDRARAWGAVSAADRSYAAEWLRMSDAHDRLIATDEGHEYENPARASRPQWSADVSPCHLRRRSTSGTPSVSKTEFICGRPIGRTSEPFPA